MRSDGRASITGINIRGYASPEGPYRNNARLAKGRSQSLRQYMIDHFGIDPTHITSDYEPEDWAGLRRYVAQSQLTHRDDILRIIDTDGDPDAKLQRIKRSYPADYRRILREAMPRLRHSDYRIDYRLSVDRVVPGRVDTIWAMPVAKSLLEESPSGFVPFRPDWALKTNLLFDAALALNLEIEVPFGSDRQWSAMVEDWFPWYVWHDNARATQLWTLGAELRRWFGGCPGKRPALTGHFVGLYAAGGKYDIEWNSTGDQSEFASFGATIGHSWVLARHWNLEASFSAGVLFGKRHHYKGRFDDTHLIWQYDKNDTYFGPTKLKLSLVWLLENPFRKKGGTR